MSVHRPSLPKRSMPYLISPSGRRPVDIRLTSPETPFDDCEILPMDLNVVSSGNPEDEEMTPDDIDKMNANTKTKVRELFSLYDRIMERFVLWRDGGQQFAMINDGKVKITGPLAAWPFLFRRAKISPGVRETSIELSFSGNGSALDTERALSSVVDYILRNDIRALKITGLHENLLHLLDLIRGQLWVLALHDCDGSGDIELNSFYTLVHLSVLSSNKLHIAKRNWLIQPERKMYISADTDLVVDADVTPFLRSLYVMTPDHRGWSAGTTWCISNEMRQIVHTMNGVIIYQPPRESAY